MPSLFFSLCLPTFKGIILVLFLSRLCRLRENPLLQSFFVYLPSSHPCLLHHPTSFFSFFLCLDFSFFIFRVFIFLIVVLQRRLQLVEHCDDIRIVFLVMVDLLLRAFLGQTVHVLRNLLHLSFFSTFRRSSRFRLGCMGLTPH